MTTLDARPMADTTNEVLLEAEGLKKYFRSPRSADLQSNRVDQGG